VVGLLDFALAGAAFGALSTINWLPGCPKCGPGRDPVPEFRGSAGRYAPQPV